MSTVIPHWLEKRVNLSPNQVAIQLPNQQKVTFKELRERAIAYAEQLAFLGVKKGDHVGVYGKNSLDFVITIHALSYLGAIGVLLNIRLTAREVNFQLNDSNTRFLLFDPSYQGFINSLGLQQDFAVFSFSEVNLGKRKTFPIPSEIDLNQIHTIIYTSGTTGFPKGVQLTYGNHWWSAISSALNLGISEHDRWLAVLPLFHVGGLSILMRSVIYGIPVHLYSKFNAEAINQEIHERGVTIVSVVTVMLEQLLMQLGKEKYPDTFRCMLLGGGPAPKVLLEQSKENQVPVFQSFGMTETASQIVTLSAQDALRKLGSAGKPLFSAQLKILINEKEASANEIGEIFVKGPMVTEGYYKRPEANQQSIRGEWLATGDLGYLDEEGFLYVVDRRKDLIISGGENVYPAEIEGVIKGLKQVREVGVTAKEDAKWGQVPVAFVVRRSNEDLSEQRIIDFCQENLAKYKVPKEIYFVSALPRNASNKLLRRELWNLLKK